MLKLSAINALTIYIGRIEMAKRGIISKLVFKSTPLIKRLF